MASPTDRTYFPPLEDCLRGKTAIMYILPFPRFLLQKSKVGDPL